MLFGRSAAPFSMGKLKGCSSVTQLQKILRFENNGQMAISATSRDGSLALREYSSIRKECGTFPPARRAGASQAGSFH